MLRIFAAFFCLFAPIIAPSSAGAFEGRAFGRNGLWRIVHGVCAPLDRVTGIPLPCLAVDRGKGIATLRAPDEATHIIVTPLQRIPGVESPALQNKDAPNYWADAWSQRDWVIQAASRPLGWDELGMAINSAPARSQDQLHIHVDCVNPAVKQALAQAALKAGRRLGPHGRNGWFDIDLRPLAGDYRAKRLSAGDLDQNIFRLVATEIPRARDNMAHETIAVIGTEDARAGRGFFLLTAGGGGHAEELLDHRCSLARN